MTALSGLVRPAASNGLTSALTASSFSSIRPGYVRTVFKNALVKACLDHSLTIHSLRQSCSSHLLEMGENILNVQKRLGHVRLQTTMVYLHVADIEPQKLVRPIDVLFPPKK